MPCIVVNGARHYYRLEGNPSRNPLILVHPIGADHSIWDKVVPLLLEDFHVLRYDLRGHGGSEATSGDYSIELLSRDLLEIATQVGLQSFSLCGISVGAMTAVHAAATAAGRVKGLIVCSAAPRMNPPPGGWNQRAAGARANGMTSLVNGMVERMFSAEHRATSDPQIDSLRTVFLRTDAEGYASCVAVLRDADLVPVLGSVRAPTLVVTGTRDPLIAPAAAEGFVNGISKADVQAIEAGHFPVVEAPEVFAKLAADFLSR